MAATRAEGRPAALRATGARTAARRPRHVWRSVRYHALSVFAGLVLVYLFLPIAYIVAFSFNDPSGKFNLVWNRFSLDAWADPFGAAGLQQAVVRSILIAFLTTIAATILGTLIALALARYRFLGRGVTNFAIFLPMATPEIVLGSSLLTLFIATNVIDLGFTTILIAHIMFCISFVVVTVKARLTGYDRRLEEAAMDLYADELTTFRRITLPLIAPGIGSAALLAFALSIDDFVITQFNSGSLQTFPLYIYGAARVGVPVQVNVIGSLIFLVAIALMVANIAWQRRRARALGLAA